MSLTFTIRSNYFVGFLCLVIVLSCSTLAIAQGGVGSTRGLPETSGGTNTIQGHLYFPEGDTAGKRVKITLESTDEMSKTTQSDADGSFLFNSLKPDRKSTRLNSSHLVISYAVFCLKKKN